MSINYRKSSLSHISPIIYTNEINPLSNRSLIINGLDLANLSFANNNIIIGKNNNNSNNSIIIGNNLINNIPNRLMIDNKKTDEPLIDADLETNRIQFNGTVILGDMNKRSIHHFNTDPELGYKPIYTNYLLPIKIGEDIKYIKLFDLNKKEKE
jgi:hypothetical protein